MASIVTADALERAINSAVRDEIEREVTKAVEEAKERVSRRIPEIVAAVSLRVHQVFSYERGNAEMLIHVRIEDK